MPTTLIRFQPRRTTAAAWTATNEVLLPGEPGYETDTGRFKLGDGTTAWNTLTYQGVLTVNAADRQFGTTRDQTQINNAIGYLKTVGGGRVMVRAADGPWTIRRRTTGDASHGGIYIDAPNITLDSDGATLTLADNCAFISAQSTTGTPVTITADTAATDTTITVTSSAGFTVGQNVFLRLGQAVYDAFEPDTWRWAKITAIPDGTHITLDQPVAYALSVAATTNVNQRAVVPITTLVENIAITGTWNLVNPATGAANAEAGISCYLVRGIRIGTIIGTTTGAAAVGGQFVDGMTIDHVRVLTSHAQSGQLSKGRGIGFSESRGVTVGVLEIADFEREAVIVEGRCEGIRVGTLIARNTYPARSTTTVGLISTLGKSQVTVDSLHVTGYATGVFGTDGGTGNDVVVNDAHFNTSTRPTLNLGWVKRRLVVNGTLYSDRRTFTRKIPLTASMTNVPFTLPKGLMYELAFYVSAVGVTGLYISDGTNATNFASSVVVGATAFPTLAQGYGSGYAHNNGTGKQAFIYTDATVPAGAYLILQMRYFADPAGSDPQLQFAY